ncbi:MAG: metal-dependent hydrolase [Nitrospiraceae bacterium]|nr:MAG: metal-dependent hydrolase [Nitrospiraceae bacterium]
MTPLGHLTVSYITGRSARYLSLPAVIIGGILPDIDFLFLFSDWFNQVHRVVTHNLLFILLASLLAAVLADKGRKQVTGLSLLLGGITHLMIDSFMDNNPTNGIGIALLWPLSDSFFSPFNLFHASLNAPGWKEPVKMFRTLVPGLVYEIPFYIASLLLFLKSKKSKD